MKFFLVFYEYFMPGHCFKVREPLYDFLQVLFIENVPSESSFDLKDVEYLPRGVRSPEVWNFTLRRF